MINLPKEYLDKMQELLKDQYDAYIESFNNDKNYALRVNNYKISNEELVSLLNNKLDKVPFINNGYYYNPEDNLTKNVLYHAGLYYIQDASAMMPAHSLPIEKGDIVLDACSAPGGKTLELLSKLDNTGLLISNDISSSRQKATLRNIETQGFRNAYVISEDLNKLEKNFAKTFDKILIDAPCSGEGMFRKEPSLINSWVERGNEYYANIQKEIVKSALNLLKDDGMMLYSTCTFDKSEDEDVLEYLLSLDDSLSIEVIDNSFDGFVGGLSENTKNALRLYPHKLNGEGHFVALIKKGKAKSQTTEHFSFKDVKLNDFTLDFLKHLSIDKTNYHYEVINNLLYLIPNYKLNTKGIRILRNGLLMGEIKKNNFEPSQALAMSLKVNEFDNVLSFELDDDRVMKYLKGETLNVSDKKLKDGFVLVCVKDYPLGFAKVNKGSLKNKIAKGWVI